MKKIICLCIIVFLFISCNDAPVYKTSAQRLREAAIADSISKEVLGSTNKNLMDTAGLSQSPVKVLSAKMIEREYSNYRDIQLRYKNVSRKKIAAIKFAWYGENAFKEPADMGDYEHNGFGRGFTDDILKSGQVKTSQWEILSKDGRTVILAWPIEVMYTDGTKWELNK